MIVTLTSILDGAEYKARPGTQYEVAEGAIVSLRVPSIDLQAEAFGVVQQVAAGASVSDYDVAKMVTTGEWPAEGACVSLVYSQVVRDFFDLVEEIGKRLLDLSIESPPSQEGSKDLEPSSQDG